MKLTEGPQLRHFAFAEFRHPELVDRGAALALDEIRETYGSPLVLTSDARTLAENAAAGGSLTSWHLQGRAFDLRMPETPELLWRLVLAVVYEVGAASVELELVSGPNDRHVHIAFPNDGRASRLLLALD